MLRLASRRNAPPGGFQFIQAETSWQSWVDAPGSDSSFDGCVVALINHRLSNPRFKLATDRASVEAEVDGFNAQRMLSIRGAESYVMQDNGPPVSFPSPQSQSRLAVAVAGIRKLRAGVGLIDAWDESGFPCVTQEQADSRAQVCIGCPKNEMGHFTRWFTVPVVDAMKKRAAKLQERKITTPFDEQLGTCAACLCVMTAKVHVPIEFIKEHQAQGVDAELDPRCWILSEKAT